MGAWIINGIDCGGRKSRQSIIAHEGPLSFWLFLFRGAHKRPLVNILKGHRTKMGLMAGFDSGLIATSNRLGWPGDGETGDPKGQRDTGSTNCEATKYTHMHRCKKKPHVKIYSWSVRVTFTSRQLSWTGTFAHKATYMSDKRICTMYRSPSANLI